MLGAINGVQINLYPINGEAGLPVIYAIASILQEDAVCVAAGVVQPAYVSELVRHAGGSSVLRHSGHAGGIIPHAGGSRMRIH